MTLAAGMVLEDSVLLFADTLYSDGITKIYGTKLFRWNGKGSQVGFALAGDAALARMAIDDCRDVLESATRPLSTSRIVQLLRPIIRRTYLEHVDARPLPERRDCNFQLLIGVSGQGDMPRLYATSETAMYQVQRYECVGVGSEIARYVIECGHDPHHPELTFDFERQAITLALQTLVAAKEHVEGVGGSSEFLLVERNRVTKAIPFNTRSVEPLARSYQNYATSLLSTLADDNEDDFVEEMLEGFVKYARYIRKRWKEASFPDDFRELIYYLQQKSDQQKKETNRVRQQRANRPTTAPVPKSPKHDRKARPPSRA